MRDHILHRNKSGITNIRFRSQDGAGPSRLDIKKVRATFKDRSEWPQYPYEWSSQPSSANHMISMLWDEHGLGKTVDVEKNTFRESIYPLRVDNVSFKTEAFKESQVSESLEENESEDSNLPTAKRPRTRYWTSKEAFSDTYKRYEFVFEPHSLSNLLNKSIEVLKCKYTDGGRNDHVVETTMMSSYKALPGLTKNLAELAQNSIDAIAEDHGLITIGGHSEGAKIAFISLKAMKDIVKSIYTETMQVYGTSSMRVELGNKYVAFVNISQGSFKIDSLFLGTTSKRDRTYTIDASKQRQLVHGTEFEHVDRDDPLPLSKYTENSTSRKKMMINRTVVEFKVPLSNDRVPCKNGVCKDGLVKSFVSSYLKYSAANGSHFEEHVLTSADRVSIKLHFEYDDGMTSNQSEDTNEEKLEKLNQLVQSRGTWRGSEDWVYSAEAGQPSERSFHDYKDALVFAKEVHRNVQASSNKTFTCIVFQNGIYIKEIVAIQKDGTGVPFTRLVIDVCGEEKCYSSRDRELVSSFWTYTIRRFIMKELKSDLIDRFVELANNKANVDFVTSMLTSVVATYSHQFKNMYKGSNNIYLSEDRDNLYFKDRLLRFFSNVKPVPNVMSILNDPNKLLEALKIDIDGDKENEFYDLMANEMKKFEKPTPNRWNIYFSSWTWKDLNHFATINHGYFNMTILMKEKLFQLTCDDYKTVILIPSDSTKNADLAFELLIKTNHLKWHDFINKYKRDQGQAGTWGIDVKVNPSTWGVGSTLEASRGQGDPRRSLYVEGNMFIEDGQLMSFVPNPESTKYRYDNTCFAGFLHIYDALVLLLVYHNIGDAAVDSFLAQNGDRILPKTFERIRESIRNQRERKIVLPKRIGNYIVYSILEEIASHPYGENKTQMREWDDARSPLNCVGKAVLLNYLLIAFGVPKKKVTHVANVEHMINKISFPDTTAYSGSSVIYVLIDPTSVKYNDLAFQKGITCAPSSSVPATPVHDQPLPFKDDEVYRSIIKLLKFALVRFAFTRRTPPVTITDEVFSPMADNFGGVFCLKRALDLSKSVIKDIESLIEFMNQPSFEINIEVNHRPLFYAIFNMLMNFQ